MYQVTCWLWHLSALQLQTNLACRHLESSVRMHSKTNRFTAKSQQAATIVPHRLGRWWNRSQEPRHNAATLQRRQPPINVLQGWWTNKKQYQTTDQIRSFPTVPSQQCHHHRSWYFSVTLTIHHSSGTKVLTRRLIDTCTQMFLIWNSHNYSPLRRSDEPIT